VTYKPYSCAAGIISLTEKCIDITILHCRPHPTIGERVSHPRGYACVLLTETHGCIMRVVTIYVYPALVPGAVPVDSDTARFEFTRLLAFCQTVDPFMYYATVCSHSKYANPLSRAVGVSWS